MSVLDEITEFERIWEKIKGRLVTTEFKTPETPKFVQPPSSVKTEDSYTHIKPQREELPPVEYTAPPATELQKVGIDVSLLDFLEYGNRLKVKKWLERPVFDELNRLLTAEGYRYNYDAKEWKFQSGNTQQEQSQPKKAAPTKDGKFKTTRISDLTPDLKSPTIEGKLLDDPVQKDIDTKRGPATVTNFRVDDGSAICKVSLWGELAEAAMNLTAGSRVQITSLMVREPYDNMPQVSTGKWSKLTEL